MAESGWLQWAYLLATTATGMSIVMIAQTANSYWTAYSVAPQEVASLIDSLDFSVEEDEGYGQDISKVQRLEDKIRLSRMLREIQRVGEDLRDELGRLVLEEGAATTLRTSSRLMWASKRAQLEERVKRLDTLRIRFMMVYLGIITSIAEKLPPPPPPPPPPMPRQQPDKATYTTPTKPSAKKSFDEFPRHTPARRLTTQAIGHNEQVETPQRSGWAGVVQELQMSPRMRARHASIEKLMEDSSP
ncbi:hypothetical protein BBK36DRAFT_1124060 [Trichoderma citrinoviride]|uniref:Uncharacterized protein n=1 Tax=Trichoderma citrinoviride TaxID=58853 RepID=A0A2T4B4F6_9HYPO|nr:hypothetical protein BBK36DRAFT_1124060 [Trichoderma citrinoviride]PTB64214.1 hypothetical protein BBK36DRAFT_1124060 [Trichoderma citrinoviride]